MAASHSLPQSHSQRVAAQLPFSPSQSGSHISSQYRQQTPTTSPSKPILPRTSISSIPPHVRSGSIVSSKSRHNVSSVGESSSHVSIPMYQPRPTSSGSGILPSASFFYPSRPNGTPPPPVPPLPSIPQIPSRPLSAGSIISSEAHIMTPVHLTSFTKHSAKASDVSDSIHASTEDLHFHPRPAGLKVTTAKHSREPLLPIGSKPTRKPTLPSRPSLSVAAGPYGRSESSISPGGIMRDSFEKLFKRNSYRKNSPAGPSHARSITGSGSRSPYISRSRQDSPISPATNGRMTFDVSDDEAPLSAVSRYKASMSPGAASSASFTPMHFNPTPPPDTHPPLAETPIIDPRGNRPVRRHRLYPSRNRFFVGGHVMTGGDSPWAFIASLLVVLGITGVWFGTTCVWWWKNESPAVAAIGAYMCLLTISSMCATAFRDPGILPRNLDPEPPYASPSGSADSLRTPLPRDLKVRAGIVRVKYCPTCRTYRPPRSSHCKMCDNCVDNCDHHCQWVNNCVGRRNYTSFFTFLFSAVLTLILVIVTTAIHLYLLTRAPFNLSFKHGLQTSQGVGSAVAFCMSIIVIWPVSALLAYHLRLLLLNVTTIEQIRNQAHKTLGGPAPPNPFSHGNWRRNLYYVMCRPAGFSWLDATGLATEDKRGINPGMLVLEEEWRSPLGEGRTRGLGKSG